MWGWPAPIYPSRARFWVLKFEKLRKSTVLACFDTFFNFSSRSVHQSWTEKTVIDPVTPGINALIYLLLDYKWSRSVTTTFRGAQDDFLKVMGDGHVVTSVYSSKELAQIWKSRCSRVWFSDRLKIDRKPLNLLDSMSRTVWITQKPAAKTSFADNSTEIACNRSIYSGF